MHARNHRESASQPARAPSAIYTTCGRTTRLLQLPLAVEGIRGEHGQRMRFGQRCQILCLLSLQLRPRQLVRTPLSMIPCVGRLLRAVLPQDGRSMVNLLPKPNAPLEQRAVCGCDGVCRAEGCCYALCGRILVESYHTRRTIAKNVVFHL